MSESVSSAGSAINEDGFVVVDDGAWVVDGASGLGDANITPGESDAHWLTSCILKHLLDSLPINAVGRLEDVTRRVFREFDGLNKPNQMDQYKYPSASLVGCVFSEGKFDAVRLGDCTLLLQSVSGEVVQGFSRSPLRNLDDAVVHEMVQRLESEQVKGPDAYRSVLSLLRANRNLINEEGGYAALTMGKNRSIAPDFFEIQVNESIRGLVCSDGFWHLVETFHLYTEQNIIEECERKGLNAMVTELRLAEYDDPDCRSFPRLKSSDDATAVLFRLSE